MKVFDSFDLYQTIGGEIHRTHALNCSQICLQSTRLLTAELKRPTVDWDKPSPESDTESIFDSGPSLINQPQIFQVQAPNKPSVKKVS